MSRKTGFVLPFDQWQCDCGAYRLAGQVCPACGRRPDPREVDVRLAARRRAVAAARPHVEHPAGPSPVLVLENLLDDWLGPLLDEIWSVARAVANGERGASERLTALAQRAGALRSWAENLSARRPLVSIMTEATAATLALVGAFTTVLDALEADDPIKAQGCRQVMQRALDKGAGALGRLGELIGLGLSLSGTDGGLGAALAAVVGGADAAGLATGGQHLLRSRLGREFPDGLAASAFLLDRLVGVVGDREAFWAAVGDHQARLCTAAGLAVVAASPELAADTDGYVHDLWVDAVRAAAAPEPVSVRDEAGQLLELGHRTMESAARILLAASTAALGGQDYASTRRQDFSLLRKTAERDGWTWAAALPVDVRHARAHQDYDVDEKSGLVRLSPQKRGAAARALSVAELRDEVLAAVEAALAAHLALSAACGAKGVEPPTGLTLIPWQPLTAQLLTAFGWREVTVVRTRNVAAVRAASSRPVRVAETAHVLAFAPEDLDELRLELRSPTETETRTVVTVDASAWRRYRAAGDEFGTGAAMVRLPASARRDGVPVLPPDRASRWAQNIAAGTLAEEQRLGHQETNRRLRVVLGLTEELSLAGARTLVARLVRWRRNAALGLPNDDDPLAEIVAAADQPLPDMPSVLFEPG